MPRVRGKTAARDYGGSHQQRRQRRLAAYRPGDTCANGGEPLWYPLPVRRNGRLVSPWLDLPHNSDRTGYLPGLSCRRHNRGDGARHGNRMRGQQRAARAASAPRSAVTAPVNLRTSRQW